ncbi:MAG: GtrA family protein, partial [Treponema sp.]|nr:GtrA family protein [Treponema sp.]
MIVDRTFLRFILVGIINTLAGLLIMLLLYNLAGLGYWLSSAINYLSTSILSFFLNKHFTFRVRRYSVLMVAAFILTIVCSYMLAYSIAKPIVHTLLKGYSLKFRDNVSLFVGMCVFTLLNYIGQR